MTVLLAAIWGKKAVIASDTLIVSGEKKVVRLKNFSKILKFPHFAVGFAGDCSIFPVMQELLKDKSYLRKLYLRMRSVEDAIRFGKDIYEGLKENLECSPVFDKEKDGEELAELLIITKTSIYSVDPYIFATEHTRFSTAGCGEDLAIGAMSILYDQIKDEKDLITAVEKAIIIACEHSNQCSMPIYMVEMGDD